MRAIERRLAALEGRGAGSTDERLWPWVCMAWLDGQPEPQPPPFHNAVVIRKPVACTAWKGH